MLKIRQKMAVFSAFVCEKKDNKFLIKVNDMHGLL